MRKNSVKLIEIGKRLKEARKQTAGTLRNMSRVSGFPVSTISEMEAGRNKPNTNYLLLLAEKYNLNMNWLFTGKGAMFSPDIDLKFDFGRDSALIMEMIYLLEHCDFVRYEMLGHYAVFKEKNRESIDKYLPKKKEQ